jgi:hypothetical protein
MPAREYLMLVRESSYGVPMAAPVKGTDLFYLRLSGSNFFSVQAKPIIQKIPYGGGRAISACAISDQVLVTGTLQGELYAGAYAKFLMDWALTPINTGRTAPWTTTDAAKVMPVGDLASMSAYHAYELDDSTFKVRRYAGAKVHSGAVTASTQDRIVKFNLNIQAIRDDLNAAGATTPPDDTEFPAPADTDYPCGPYLLSHTTGKLKIAVARSLYSSIGFKWQNTMDPRFFESKYLLSDRLCGRDSSLDVEMYLKATPDDEASYKALTALDSELTFDNGTNTLKIDMNTVNRWADLTRDLPIGASYGWKGSLQNYWDPSVANDITVSGT